VKDVDFVSSYATYGDFPYRLWYIRNYLEYILMATSKERISWKRQKRREAEKKKKRLDKK
jgi:hypothetical protein